jgi:outer membrane protein assembly factor BamD
MISSMQFSKRALLAACALGLLASCVHKKYETPITKKTQQPDKILFDQAMHDIEKGRYEVARISLQTLMNTYESSEYMAKAKLAVADSWFREGGASGMAQAEAEYKDFILFYPSMEESAEAQNRVCEIHYKQMDKSDRDVTQTLRAETECKNLLLQFPNSKFAPQAAQRLREIQESLAASEANVGYFYWKRDMNPAAANRLATLVDQYPLYSKADEALYEAGDAYSKMGPRYRQKAGEMFSRLVRDYPLGRRAPDAKKRLEDLEMPVPQADEKALARMKYEQENYKRRGLVKTSMSFVGGGPDVSHAAKQGSPTMTDPKRTIPASVPAPVNTSPNAAGNGTATGTTDVTASTVGSNSSLDTKTDARQGSATLPTPPEQPQAALPTNRDTELKQMQKERAKRQAAIDKKNKKKKNDKSNGSATTPASASNGATGATSTAPPAQPQQTPQ